MRRAGYVYGFGGYFKVSKLALLHAQSSATKENVRDHTKVRAWKSPSPKFDAILKQLPPNSGCRGAESNTDELQGIAQLIISIYQNVLPLCSPKIYWQ